MAETLWTANDGLPATVTLDSVEGLRLASPDNQLALHFEADGVLDLLADLRAWLTAREGRGLRLSDPETGTAVEFTTEQVRLLAVILGTALDPDQTSDD
ncbi:MAG: hypothetical protein ACP5QO_14285 [Clostridia bacterium]